MVRKLPTSKRKATRRELADDASDVFVALGAALIVADLSISECERLRREIMRRISVAPSSASVIFLNARRRARRFSTRAGGER